MTKSIHKPKRKKDKATFYSPSEVWCLAASSSTKPEEREFVVDSRASMHKLSRKDLSGTGHFTGIQRLSQPTEKCKRTRKLQCTSTISKNSPQEKSSRIHQQFYRLEFCEDHGYSHEWTSGQKTHLMKNCRKNNAIRRITCQSLSRDCQQAVPVGLEVHLRHRQVQQTIRRRSTSSSVLEDQLRGSEKPEDENKDIHLVGRNLFARSARMVGGFH